MHKDSGITDRLSDKKIDFQQMNQFCHILICKIIVLSLSVQINLSAKVYQANGIKIGEVTSSSAIIRTRLTKFPERNVDGVPFPKVPWQKVETDNTTYLYRKPQIPQGYTLDQMQDIVPGEMLKNSLKKD